MPEKKKILELRKLKKYFPVSKGVDLKALEDVSFVVYEGEKFGIVGESGCGKSTLGRTILQLYEQTSGSCTYYGKSVQEINPQYVLKNIRNLPNQQKKAKECYQKSLEIDRKVRELQKVLTTFDAERSAKDAQKYDRIENQMNHLEFLAKEQRKQASRYLREGSRTVGSLILAKELDKVVALFLQAQQETEKAHQAILRYRDLKAQYDENEYYLQAKDTIHQDIEELESCDQRSEELESRLQDLRQTKRKISHMDITKLRAKSANLLPQLHEISQQIQQHKQQEKAYRQEAFVKYGKDMLPITERALQPAYQQKLDRNYETGINLAKLTKKELQAIRPDMQMVFQDPAASMDPRQTIGKAVEEPFLLHTDLSPSLRKEKVLSLLHDVDLKPEHYYVYPNALSGGMKQRAGIARAIALDPTFIVLDEAVSALDVSVQAQILQLLQRLREEKNLTYLFITHDLGVVKHFCDRVLVMYLGNFCELADAKELFQKPLHPYTESLLAAVPHLDVEQKHEENILQGEVPSPIHPPTGCPFHTRCKKCMEICEHEKPQPLTMKNGHIVACHLYATGGEL